MVFYSYEIPHDKSLYTTLYATSGVTFVVELFVLITFWRRLCYDHKRQRLTTGDNDYSYNHSSICCCSCRLYDILSIRTLSLWTMIIALLTILCAVLGVLLENIHVLLAASCFEVLFILLFLIVYILRLYETFANSIYKLKRSSILIYVILVFILIIVFITVVIIRFIWQTENDLILDLISSIHWIIVGIISISVCILFNMKLYRLYSAQHSSIVYITYPKVSDVGTFDNNNNNSKVTISKKTMSQMSDLYKGSGDLSNNNEQNFSKYSEKKSSNYNTLLNHSNNNNNNTGASLESQDSDHENLYNASGKYIGEIDRSESKRLDPIKQQSAIMNQIIKQTLLINFGILSCLLIVVTSIDWLFITNNDNNTLSVAYEFVFLHCFFQMTIIITLWLSFRFSNNYYHCICNICEHCYHQSCTKCTNKYIKMADDDPNNDYHELNDV